MAGWDPDRYLRFRQQRRQPYEDLVALVQPDANMRVVDLGCGPGELSADLARRFEGSSVVGVDNDGAMLERASQTASERVQFVHADIADFDPGSVDLVFSNAALHWLPNHADLFARLVGCLAPGGQLAVQMPNNFAQPTHTTAVALASEAPYAGLLGGVTSGAAVLRAEDYATLLAAQGLSQQVVREQIYLHHLPGPEDVVEWVAGSMLTWYASRLGAAFGDFRVEYERRLLAALGGQRPYPFTYRRVLLWARR